jgi:PAS domain S-box-containing protein
MPPTAQFVGGHLRGLTAAWLVWVTLLGPAYAMEIRGGAKFRSPSRPEFYGSVESPPPWLVLAGGLRLGTLLASLVWVQGRRRRDAEILGLNADFERRLAERTAQLRKANADLSRFKAITEATTDLVNIAGTDGRILFLNQGGRRLLGIPADEDATQLHLKDLAPPSVIERFEREGFPAAFRDGSWRGEVALLHRDGHEIPVSFVGLVIRPEAGQPQYLAGVARDISDQRRLTEQLKGTLAEERELNLLQSNFISMVSHEIRTPLALILSSSEILSRYLDRLAPEKRQRHLETIHDAVQRMALLVEDVLVFSRAEAGRLEFRPQPLDLNGFCTRLAGELESATRRRCPIRLGLLPPADPVRVDEALVRHILTNLVSNAIKYSQPGEAVSLEVRRGGENMLFRISDQGIGIPPADLKRLFTPFYRGQNVAHITGTGLGLVIVKRCVERHGGNIQVESREGAGTTVTVQLPVYVPGQTELFVPPAAATRS